MHFSQFGFFSEISENIVVVLRSLSLHYLFRNRLTKRWALNDGLSGHCFVLFLRLVLEYNCVFFIGLIIGFIIRSTSKVITRYTPTYAVMCVKHVMNLGVEPITLIFAVGGLAKWPKTSPSTITKRLIQMIIVKLHSWKSHLYSHKYKLITFLKIFNIFFPS